MNRRRERGGYYQTTLYIYMHEILFYFKRDFKYYSTGVLNAKALSVST